MKLYVASSWRNDRHPSVVAALRQSGHEVYDFRNPMECDNGFHWSEIDPEWREWTPEEFRRGLSDPIARRGFETDWKAMQRADACVLVMPCGRSAHLEAGWFVGAGRPLLILLSDGEPELMYAMASRIYVTLDEMVNNLGRYEHTYPGSGLLRERIV